MGAVTEDASFLHRRVDMFFFLESFLLVGMAGETNIIAGGHEELRIIAFVGVVTNSAATDSHRAMNIFPCCQLLVMADKA